MSRSPRGSMEGTDLSPVGGAPSLEVFWTLEVRNRRLIWSEGAGHWR